MFDQLTFQRSLPAKRMGAGALIRDGRGGVLLVEPTYKPQWEIPGGSVEADESPRQACVREIHEELGLQVDVGRLLCWEWQGPEHDRTESLMFVFDGGVLPAGAAIRLADNELRSWAFVAPDRFDDHLVERLSRRLRHALDALGEGGVIELEDGVRTD